jgi:hypothetical protein
MPRVDRPQLCRLHSPEERADAVRLLRSVSPESASQLSLLAGRCLDSILAFLAGCPNLIYLFIGAELRSVLPDAVVGDAGKDVPRPSVWDTTDGGQLPPTSVPVSAWRPTHIFSLD